MNKKHRIHFINFNLIQKYVKLIMKYKHKNK